jgi:hypothetical protein
MSLTLAETQQKKFNVRDLSILFALRSCACASLAAESARAGKAEVRRQQSSGSVSVTVTARVSYCGPLVGA